MLVLGADGINIPYIQRLGITIFHEIEKSTSKHPYVMHVPGGPGLTTHLSQSTGQQCHLASFIHKRSQE